MDEEKVENLNKDQVKGLVKGMLRGLGEEDLDSIAGGKESYYDAIYALYWGLNSMRCQGKTKEEAYAWAEERFADNQPYIESAINAYITDMWDKNIYCHIP